MDDPKLKNLRGKKLLLVEDDEFVRDATVRILSLYGLEIISAGDLSEAMAEFSRDKFNLALIDVNIPGGGGIEVYRKIRADKFDFPMILISGDLDSEIADSCREDRYLSFVHKPYDPIQMANQLAVICGA
jgi:DNA-binding NtrC family response regulator